MTVPVFSLAPIDAQVDLVDAVRRVVAAHQYVLGKAVERFERSFARYCGTEHCVGVANGTDALELALRALGVGTDDRVVLVANAGHYGSAAVRAIGAIPVYVDVDATSLLISIPALRAGLAGGAGAVIATHLYGRLADMDAVLAVAQEAGVPVIEDCAQAHGARRDGRVAGSFGDIACFSFYPTKNLGAIGDAGAVVTSDIKLADQVRRLRQHGWERKYQVSFRGGRNSRLDEIQAAVLDIKLPHLDRWNSERRAIAGRYADGLSGLPIGLPPAFGEDYVAHLFVIQADDRDSLQAHLRDRGVGTDVHYPVPDHRQAAYSSGGPTTELPTTDAACDHVLTLPCYPGLAKSDQDVVIGAIRSFYDATGE